MFERKLSNKQVLIHISPADTPDNCSDKKDIVVDEYFDILYDSISSVSIFKTPTSEDVSVNINKAGVVARTFTGTWNEIGIQANGNLDIISKKLPKAIKGPPKIYADTLNHISIEDDALRTNTDISLSVLQNTIPSITLKVPEGYSILNVRGHELGDWQELIRGESTYLEIPFDYPKQGNFTISITAEKLLPNASMAVDFNGFSVKDAIREKYYSGDNPEDALLMSIEF